MGLLTWLGGAFRSYTKLILIPSIILVALCVLIFGIANAVFQVPYSIEIYILGSNYFIGSLVTYYVYDKIRSKRRVKEIGRDDAYDDLPASLGLIVFGSIWLTQASIIVVGLFLSIFFGIITSLPLWFSIVCGVVSGCGSVLILIWSLESDIDITDIIWFFSVFSYPLVILLFAYVINLMF